MTFNFYLDAWHHCQRNGINPERIRKLSFRVWEVVEEEEHASTKDSVVQ